MEQHANLFKELKNNQIIYKITIAVPIPKPYITRPTKAKGNISVVDWIKVPIRKSKEAICNSAFLPILLSPMNIIKLDDTIAPSKLELAIWPNWIGSNCPNSLRPAPNILKTDEDEPISRP